mgnify:CR=1 FL=1
MNNFVKNFDRIQKLINNSDYENALITLKDQYFEGHPETYYFLGLIYHRLRNQKMSGKMILRTLLIDPFHKKALFLLQHLFYRNGKFDVSIIILKRCMVVSSNSVFIYKQLSSRMTEVGQVNKSIHISQLILSKKKKDFESCFYFAECLEAAGILRTALKFYIQIKKELNLIPSHKNFLLIENKIRNLIIEIIAEFWRDRVNLKKFHQTLTMASMLSITKGFYHNFPIGEQFSTFDIGGIVDNSPAIRNDFNSYLSELVFSRIFIQNETKVLDIGGADGYFTIEAARRGAQVKMIEPGGFFCGRAQILAKISEVEHNVCVQKAFLNPSHRNDLKNSDIIFALGLIYHFENFVEDIDLIIQSQSVIVFETVGSLDTIWNEEEAWNYKVGKTISLRWVCDRLIESGYEIEFVPEWNRYCAKYSKNRNFNSTRQLLIAHPRTEN